MEAENKPRIPAEEKLRRAFDHIYTRYEFFAPIVMAWKVREAPIETAATDGPNMYWSRKFVNQCSVTDTIDLVMHEAGHVFLGHHKRFGNRDPHVWNVSADEGLNSYLRNIYHPDSKVRREGLFPGEGIFGMHPRDKDAEFYYELNKKPAPQPEPQQGEDEGEDAAGEPQDGQGASQSRDEGQDSGPGEKDEMGQGQEASDENGPGTEAGEDGESLPSGTTQTRTDLPKSIGEVLPHPASDGTQEEQEQAEREWEELVANCINAGKAAGNLPGWARELGEAQYAHRSKVTWKLFLRQFLTRYAPVRLTYSRPNRRHSYRTDIILPARHSLEAADICVLTDVSGSMDVAQMNVALREIEAIMRAYERCSVTLRMSDTRLIEDERTFTKWDFPIKVPQEWKGRGGTDLGPAIREIAKANRFKCLIVVSDMYWDAGEVKRAGIPVMWIYTREATDSYSKPTFGQTIGPLEAA